MFDLIRHYRLSAFRSLGETVGDGFAFLDATVQFLVVFFRNLLALNFLINKKKKKNDF